MFLMDSLIRRCARGVPKELEIVARAEGMDPAGLARGHCSRKDCNSGKPEADAPAVRNR